MFTEQPTTERPDISGKGYPLTKTRITRKAPTRMKAPVRKSDTSTTEDASPAAKTSAEEPVAAPVEAQKAAKAPAKKTKGKKAEVPTFAELGLDPKILKALGDLGYDTPTPIQAQSIPLAMQNRDILGIAQTGTGKTGAFTLPVMHRLAKGRARARMPRCLVVCPTRELAAQVAENIEQYGKYLKLEMALLIGGVSFAKQEAKLNKGVDILIATPGRLLDQFERGKILLTGVQTLVVDEADRMLDMGFIPDIERIFEITPFTRQVLFFSATMAPELTRIVDSFLHNPVRIEVARESRTADTVTQRIITMPSNDTRAKRNALRGAIEQSEVKNGIVFCNRKRDVDIVAKSLTKHGHDARAIHGDLPQSERTKTLQDFRDGKLKLLVASDVAARGLDVPDVSHVFNFDVPSHAEDYVHRIGRTGRAGRKGDTIMLVAPGDKKNYDAVKSLIQVDMHPEFKLEGISLDADVREGDQRNSRNKDRNSRGRNNSRGRSNSSRGGNERRDRPVADHGQRADMEPIAKTDAKPTQAKSNARRSEKPKQDSTSKDNSNNRNSNQSKPQNTPAKATSGDSSKRSNNKPANAKGKSGNRKAGFGDDMPAFFGNTLK